MQTGKDAGRAASSGRLCVVCVYWEDAAAVGEAGRVIQIESIKAISAGCCRSGACSARRLAGTALRNAVLQLGK